MNHASHENAPEQRSGNLPLPVKRLIAISLVMDVIVSAMVHGTAAPPKNPFAVVYFALMISQLGLIGVVIGLINPLRRPVMVIACVLGVAGWIGGFQFTTDRLETYIAVQIVGFVGAIALGLITARLAGLWLYRQPPDALSGHQASRDIFQFTLRDVFIWTTIAAVVVVATRFVISIFFLLPLHLPDVVLLATWCVMTWLLVFTLLGTWSPLRILMLLLLWIAGGFAWSQIRSQFAFDLYIMAMTGLNVLLTGASLAVFRACGYRIGRKSLSDEPQAMNAER